jgi:hypothetical protein
MNKIILCSAGLILAASSAAAAPFFAIGDNAQLFLTGKASVRFDDNILTSNALKISDTIFEVTPGIDLEIGKNAQFKSKFSFTESFTRYEKTAGLNTELGSFSLLSTYENGKTSAEFDASLRQLNQNTPTSGVTGGLLRRNETSAGAKAQIVLTPKSELGVGFGYDRINYKAAGLVNSKIYTVPVNYYHELTPKIDGSVGVRYRLTQLASTPDSSDYYYNVGLRGEYTPKLRGTFSVGYDQRSIKGGKDESSIGLDSSLTYDFSPKTKATLVVSNDFGSASAGQSQEIFSLSAGIQSELGAQWIGFGNISYNSINYAGPRKDDFNQVTVGATYLVNEMFSVSGTYSYKKNSSNVAGQDYTVNVFAVSASVRY